ncbi:hypothetical protein RJ639_027396 [Escallonia herrerae]|uniref:Response regulatory domain-containing protein n=1 Tax=Escallonia herrerae TaxID=1293975 RepID=A0AA88X733_9ASTE|nr:hypothetical protein RJ639_027396 [Escallonia herrerae]
MVFGTGSSSTKSTKGVEEVGGNLSVLIVDDDPIILRIHRMMLNKFGLVTHVVENGKEAVDLFRSGSCFDMVLMDMEMPIMDGPKATQELRAMGVNSMIVGVTSRGLESEKQSFMGAGLNRCHEKPLTTDIVTSLVQELIKHY